MSILLPIFFMILELIKLRVESLELREESLEFREFRVENFSQGVLEILEILGMLGKLEILGWVILNSKLSPLTSPLSPLLSPLSSLNWIRFFSNFSLRPLSTAHRQRQG